MASPDAKEWQKAMDDELQSMKDNKVWEFVLKPFSRKEAKKINIIDSKWIYKRKTDVDGKVIFKARLVIRGFKDKNEYELKETYAPVSNLPLIRATLAIANKYGYDICQMDVKTAFLNGELIDPVYMTIPEGLKVDPDTQMRMMCKVNKSIYGLRISPNRWGVKFTSVVLEMGFENTEHEPCLYTWVHGDKRIAIVLYVDDMLIISNCPEKLKELKQRLNEVFQMKDLGEPRCFLGMNISRNRETRELFINQSDYTEKILERFNMTDCHKKFTPMETRQVQKKKYKDLEESDTQQQVNTPRVPYREAIGSLLYLAGGTRPDIAYTVNVLSRRQIQPTIYDWEDVKHFLRYLRGTTNYGLRYTVNGNGMEVNCDISFKDWNDSTSTGGFVMTMFGDPVLWKSYKQSLVCQSTAKAEYL